MQRLLKVLVATVAMTLLTAHFAPGPTLAQVRDDAPAGVAQDATPESSQQADEGDDSSFELAGVGGMQAPYSTQFEDHLTIRPDLTATETATVRITILVPAAVQPLSQQQLQFAEGAETLDIIEAFTEKSDGRRIPVEPVNIITQDAATGLQASYTSGLKQRTIIFPDVGVGDTLVFTARKENLRSALAGQFSDVELFPRSRAFTSAQLLVEAPETLDLQVKTTGGIDSVDVSGGTRRHHITIASEPYRPDEPGAVSPIDRDPLVVVSTLKSYEEVGQRYGAAAWPKAAVTPEIAAAADEITRNITDRKAQAMAIDAWMKKNIRYVGVYLALERAVVPNEAATVLRNKFGDCKDKATLMAALLAAKGIASEEVLINLGNIYKLPEPPTPAAFNHAILYLPDFDLYDDPTASLAAFGVLAAEAYDKPVVRVSAMGAKVARTPAMRPQDHISHATTSIHVAADGTVTGQTRESGTGIFGATLRHVGGVVETMGDETAANRVLQGFGAPGSGHFDLGNTAETADPAETTGSFTLNDRFRAPAGARTAIPFGMPLLARPGVFLLGSRLAGRQSAFVCFAGQQIEDIDATFDESLPMPVPISPLNLDSELFSYHSTYKIEGRTLKVHRELISRVSGQTCTPEQESRIADDMKVVGTDVFTGYAFGNPQQTAAAPPQTLEIVRIATIGQRLRLEFLYALNVDCSSMGAINVRIVEQPKHGTAVVQQAAGKTSFPKENPRSQCNDRDSAGMFVLYDPESDFSGADSVTIEGAFPNGAVTRRHYSITVNSPPPVATATPPMPRPEPAALTVPQTLELRRVAVADRQLQLAFLFDLNPDCSSIGFVSVRMTEDPKHGKLTIENGTGFSTFAEKNLRFECNKRRTDGVVVSYTPEPGYVGADSLAMDVIYPDGNLGKRRYSIEVR